MTKLLDLFEKLTGIHFHLWKVVKTIKGQAYDRIDTLQCKCGITKERTRSGIGFSEYC